MKTFIQFLEEQKSSSNHAHHPFETSFGHDEKAKKHHYPAFETSFGHDEKAKKHHYPAFETSFGHDEKAKKHHKHEDVELVVSDVISEAVSKTPGKITAKEQVAEHSKAEADKIHNDNKMQKSVMIQKYTGSGAYVYNRGLHHHYRHEVMGLKKSSTSEKHDKLSKFDKEDIHDLDAHLDKHTIKHDIHVYSGLPHSPVHAFKLQNAKKGKSIKVHLPAYTSTTTHFHLTNNFSHDMKHEKHDNHTPINSDAPHDKDLTGKYAVNHVLKLHVPKGTKGGSVRDQSYHKHEHEILLHRGHNIEIHPHPTVMEDGTHVWHARVISHTPHKID